MVVLFLMNVFIGIICTHYVNVKNMCEISFGEEIANMIHLIRKRMTSGPRFAGTQGEMPPMYVRAEGKHTYTLKVQKKGME
jgi:hypothetical protein